MPIPIILKGKLETNCRMSRWIGFDMDECMGSLMPLYPFLTELPRLVLSVNPEFDINQLFITIQQRIIESEIAERTWLLRPALRTLLDHIYLLYTTKNIDGVFVFSNNSSPEIVSFTCFLCDGYMWHRNKDNTKPQIFKFGAYLHSPFRQNYGEKSLREINNAFKYTGLEIPDPKNIIFFDDQIHILSYEITNYVHVKPYLHYTNHGRIVTELKSLIELLTPSTYKEFTLICASAYLRDTMARTSYKMEKQNMTEAEVEKVEWITALNTWLGLYNPKIGYGIAERAKKARQVSHCIHSK